jgi:hypothetical protein
MLQEDSRCTLTQLLPLLLADTGVVRCTCRRKFTRTPLSENIVKNFAPPQRFALEETGSKRLEIGIYIYT